MERRIEGLMNRVVPRKVSQPKRRGMRSLSACLCVCVRVCVPARRPQVRTNTHNPHFINNRDKLLLASRLSLQSPLLPLPNPNSFTASPHQLWKFLHSLRITHSQLFFFLLFFLCESDNRFGQGDFFSAWLSTVTRLLESDSPNGTFVNLLDFHSYFRPKEPVVKVWKE